MGHHAGQAVWLCAAEITADPVQQLLAKPFPLRPKKSPVRGRAQLRHHLR
jgi:hypothetical protein